MGYGICFCKTYSHICSKIVAVTYLTCRPPWPPTPSLLPQPHPRPPTRANEAKPVKIANRRHRARGGGTPEMTSNQSPHNARRQSRPRDAKPTLSVLFPTPSAAQPHPCPASCQACIVEEGWERGWRPKNASHRTPAIPKSGVYLLMIGKSASWPSAVWLIMPRMPNIAARPLLRSALSLNAFTSGSS